MLGQIISSMGYEFTAFDDRSALVEGLRQSMFDLILLDLTLADSNAAKIAELVSKKADSAPAVVMTLARSAKSEIASVLSHGADDYILKPEDDNVIRARISAVLRKSPPGASMTKELSFGDYVLNRLTQSVEFKGKIIELTAKEFDLAELLFTHRDKTLSRSFIMERIWRTNAKLATRTLDMHISRLRSKLKLDGTSGFRIFTVFGHGYRMDSVQPQ